MTEAWNCRKFEFGLKQELKEVVIPMSIRDFPALVEKSKVVESLKSSSKLAKPQVGGPSKICLNMKIERNLISYLNLIIVEDLVLNHHLVSDVLDMVGHMLLDFSLIQCQM